MLEIECKFAIADPEPFLNRLRKLQAVELPEEHHLDTYFRHPCRDFAQTNEALRLRRINGQAFVTYKGPKQPGLVKVRQELEWRLAAEDENGSQTEQLWALLGFTRVAVVEKVRRPFKLIQEGQAVTATFDRVKALGNFAEIEVLAEAQESERGKNLVLETSRKLGLERPEPRSYLSLLLQQSKEIPQDFG